MQILVPMIAALVPMVIAPGLLFHFDITPKVAILLYGISIALLFGQAGWVEAVTARREPLTRWFIAVLACQFVWFAITAALSGDRALSVDGSEWRRLGLYTYGAVLAFSLFLLQWLRAPGRLIVLLRWSVAAGGLIALYTVAQYAGVDPLLPASAYRAGEGPFTIVRPPGTLGHADYAASYLAFVVFIALGLARIESVKAARITAVAIALLSCLAVVLSGTRGGLVALVGGVAVLALLDRNRLRHHALAGIAVLAIIAGLFVSPVGAKLRARVHWSLEDPYGGARLLLWRDTVRMSWTRPLSGFGPEAFILRFPQYQSLELSRAYPDFLHESPHNILLDSLAGEGIPGALLLLTGWVLAFYAGLKAVRAGYAIAAPLCASAVALLISHQFAAFVPPTAFVFFMMEAMALSICSGETRQHASRAPSVRKWATAAVSILFVVEATRLVISDHALVVAQQRMARDDVGGARAAYQTATRWAAGSTSDLYYSRAMASLATRTPVFQTRLDAWHEAIRSGAVAAERSEQRQNAWYSLAALFAAQNDSASVERSLRNAIAWAPNWFKPHWTLAEYYRLNGRPRDAIVEAALALERNGGKNPEVVSTWKLLSNKAAK